MWTLREHSLRRPSPQDSKTREAQTRKPTERGLSRAALALPGQAQAPRHGGVEALRGPEEAPNSQLLTPPVRQSTPLGWACWPWPWGEGDPLVLPTASPRPFSLRGLLPGDTAFGDRTRFSRKRPRKALAGEVANCRPHVQPGPPTLTLTPPPQAQHCGQAAAFFLQACAVCLAPSAPRAGITSGPRWAAWASAPPDPSPDPCLPCPGRHLEPSVSPLSLDRHYPLKPQPPNRPAPKAGQPHAVTPPDLSRTQKPSVKLPGL